MPYIAGPHELCPAPYDPDASIFLIMEIVTFSLKIRPYDFSKYFPVLRSVAMIALLKVLISSSISAGRCFIIVQNDKTEMD